MTRFSSQAEGTLRRAGWRPGRQVPSLVASWKESLIASRSEFFGCHEFGPNAV